MNEQQGIKPYVIGLDLGGTNAVFGIVDQRGDIKATTAIKTQQYDTAEAFIEASVNALQPIIEKRLPDECCSGRRTLPFS